MVESLECRIQKCAPIFISELNDDITKTDNHSNVNIFLMHAYSNMHYRMAHDSVSLLTICHCISLAEKPSLLVECGRHGKT